VIFHPKDASIAILPTVPRRVPQHFAVGKNWYPMPETDRIERIFHQVTECLSRPLVLKRSHPIDGIDTDLPVRNPNIRSSTTHRIPDVKKPLSLDGLRKPSLLSMKQRAGELSQQHPIAVHRAEKCRGFAFPLPPIHVR